MPQTRFHHGDGAHSRSYVPSQFDGEYLTPRHAGIGSLVESVPGKLRQADELKLYEMAYLARGPILEIGTDQGRSLAIMAIATRDAGRREPIYSVDISSTSLDKARSNLARLGLLEFVYLVHGDSGIVVAESSLVFDLAFVDGDHTYEGVRRDLAALKGRVAPGGSILFHDYYDERNEDPEEPTYGVSQAVEAAQEENNLRFRGGCGAIGIYEQL